MSIQSFRAPGEPQGYKSSRPARRSYITVSEEAVKALEEAIETSGVQTALDIPSTQPSYADIVQESWARGARIGTYSYLAGKLISALDRRAPHELTEDQLQAKELTRGFYGQLGASILLRTLQYGVATYQKSAPSPNVNECAEVMSHSFEHIVHPLAAQPNEFGTRLEILYNLTGRGEDAYQDFAQAAPDRYEFIYAAKPTAHIALDSWGHALFSADKYPELEPTLPQNTNTNRRCPLVLTPPNTDKQRSSSLQSLWEISIQTCTETPWIWPQAFAEDYRPAVGKQVS